MLGRGAWPRRLVPASSSTVRADAERRRGAEGKMQVEILVPLVKTRGVGMTPSVEFEANPLRPFFQSA